MELPPLTRDASRNVDKRAMEDYGICGLVLMENAGRNCAEWIARLSPAGRILILCGRGNNAGDGYVIARHLQLLEREVEIVSLVALDELSGDAEVNAGIAESADIRIAVRSDAEGLRSALGERRTLVDCLLGTGATGPPREPYRTAVMEANRCDATRIAVDVPTGLDCDTGEANEPTFRADHTLTFVAAKVGYGEASAAPYVGELHPISIGIPLKLLNEIASQSV